MHTQRILRFLTHIAHNNTRPWMEAHKDEYLWCRDHFWQMGETFIARLAEMDSSVAHISVKDATYRFNRDTRFSPDKSPYKTHFGLYVAAHGKKSLHGGYYLHLEPGHCLLACGTYWLPTHILTACRNEIMGNFAEWASIVESPTFVSTFGRPGEGVWGDARGFGLAHLKSGPAGFPRDYEHMEYLRMKDYCAWVKVDDNFFDHPLWMEQAIDLLRIGKPMMDFINDVVDDYE
ncbi:MAG: DUF2461 domain-containing protein [Bacteroidaceae bacterium]|nr:DUF2461 domain-containing protein [Bacteroidaceae bacterium]